MVIAAGLWTLGGCASAGGQLYDVRASKDVLGEEFPEQEGLKASCDTIEVLTVEVRRSSCKIGVVGSESGSVYSFAELDEDTVDRYGLEPNPSWWDRTALVIVGAAALAAGVATLLNRSSFVRGRAEDDVTEADDEDDAFE